MIKKFIAKLIGWREQRANFSKMRNEGFKDKQKLESDLAKERQKAIREGQWEEVQLPDSEKSEEDKKE